MFDVRARAVCKCGNEQIVEARATLKTWCNACAGNRDFKIKNLVSKDTALTPLFKEVSNEKE